MNIKIIELQTQISMIVNIVTKEEMSSYFSNESNYMFVIHVLMLERMLFKEV